MKVIDMNTTEGLIEHFRTLPSASLEAIAARPIWNAESAVQAVTAGLVLDSRTVLINGHTCQKCEREALVSIHGGGQPTAWFCREHYCEVAK